jgi:LPS export ABC transporter protein LptC
LNSNRKPYILLSILLLFYSCENDIATVNKITSPNAASVETGKDIQMLYSDFGKVKAKLVTPQLQEYHNSNNPYIEMTKGLFVYFYNDSLRITSTLKADYGIYYPKTDIFIARENVVVVNEKGDQLSSEELVWNEHTKKLTSDKFVKIATADEVIFGDGLEANQDFTQYKIKKIKGTVKVNNEGLPND